MARAPWRAVALLLALAIASSGCARQPPPRGGDAPSGGESAPAVFILDADRYGAVVFDEQGRYLGVRRDGAIAWRAPAGTPAFRHVSCLARCPDAVLSGSLEATNSRDVADPEPQVVIAGRWRQLPGTDGHKRRILTASSADAFMLATGSDRRWWLERHQEGAVASRVQVGGWDSSWDESADGRHALMVTTVVGGASEARWLTRAGGHWRVVGETARVRGFGACVAPDGRRALLLGQRPVLLDRDGGQRSVTTLVSAGTCAWAASGGIVAELAQTPDGPRSRLRAFDAAGTVRWRLNLRQAVSVTADPTSALVAYVADRVLHEVDPARGVELGTVTDVQAARYTAGGALVIVGVDGKVRWRR